MSALIAYHLFKKVNSSEIRALMCYTLRSLTARCCWMLPGRRRSGCRFSRSPGCWAPQSPHGASCSSAGSSAELPAKQPGQSITDRLEPGPPETTPRPHKHTPVAAQAPLVLPQFPWQTATCNILQPYMVRDTNMAERWGLIMMQHICHRLYTNTVLARAQIVAAH